MIRIVTVILLFLIVNAWSQNTQHYQKLWSSAIITGPLSVSDPNFRFYLEPRLRFMGDKYVFEEASIYAGLGYQINPMSLYLGDAIVTQLNPDGKYQHENRVFEQLDLAVINTVYYKLLNKTRLEERKNSADIQWAVRLREKLTLRVPFKNQNKYSLVIADEIFLNLNHPKWVSSSFFAENRGFIGIGNQLSQSTTLDIGYMNQLKIQNPNQVNNILNISLTTNVS